MPPAVAGYHAVLAVLLFALSSSDIVFIMLINVKMPTGIFLFGLRDVLLESTCILLISVF